MAGNKVTGVIQVGFQAFQPGAAETGLLNHRAALSAFLDA
jgi:hypothetical protein